MAEINITGYWKGTAVTPNVLVSMNVYLEQKGGELNGRYEAYDENGNTESGSLNGTVRGNEINMSQEDGQREFRGEVSGTGKLIFGTVRRSQDPFATSTLTLVLGEREVAAITYDP